MIMRLIVDKFKLLSLAPELIKKRSFAIYALTNMCNAKCEHCSIWSTKQKFFPSLNNAKLAIDALDKIGIFGLMLGGGEPLLHPDVYEIIKYAKSKKMHVSIVTNGKVLNEDVIKNLKESGINSIGISIDHYNPMIMNKTRGIPNLLENTIENLKILNKYQIKAVSSTAITRYNFLEIEKILSFMSSIGFKEATFQLPTKSTRSSYEIGSNSEILNFTNQELVSITEEIISLKKKYKIFNSYEGLSEVVRFLKGEPAKFFCRAGYKFFYVDWNNKIWRCQMSDECYGDINNLKSFKFSPKKCEKCRKIGERESSVYFNGIKSIIPIGRIILNELR